MRQGRRLGALLVIVVSVWMAVSASAQPATAPAPVDGNPFAGKVVSVYILHEPDYGMTMHTVSVVQLGGRTFLRGIVVEEEDNWRSGKENWVAVEHVTEITIFDSLEEYHEAGEEFDVRGIQRAAR